MAYDGYYGFAPYVSAAQRRGKALRHAAALAKKHKRALAPVVISGRKIAQTFWGQSWCQNLERYSDFASRLPRGRSYARNGCVIDLRIEPGRVAALVSGTDVYEIEVLINAVGKTHWRTICRDSTGAIDSVVELLQGRLSTAVMTRLCRPGAGLFPGPKEITFSCSCPDGAWMCKHIAAVLYGVGARLDDEPALLFTLRKVKAEDLITRAGVGAALAKPKTPRGAKPRRTIEDDASLGAIFGLEIAGKRKRAKPEPRAAAWMRNEKPGPT